MPLKEVIVKDIRIGVIGLGYLGKHHARILSQLENVSLKALIDEDFSIAESLSSQYGGKAFNDFRDAIELVDAFVIATPTSSHYSIAKECLRQSKHLFIEKPITLNSKEAQELITLSESMGLIIQVGHIERFNPAFIYAKKRIKNPLYFESERLSPYIERAINIDVSLDLLIHDIDLILTIMREKELNTTIKEISAEGLSMVSQKTDYVLAKIRFNSPVTAVLKASRIAQDKRREMYIYGVDSYLILDFSRQKVTEFNPEDKTFKDIDLNNNEEPLRVELSSFIHSIMNNLPPIVTAQEALQALQIAERVNQLTGA